MNRPPEHFPFLYISILSRLPFPLYLFSIPPRSLLPSLTNACTLVSSLSSLLSASSRNDKFSRLKSRSVRDRDHDHNHGHRPLPLLWCVYVRTARRAWKCGLYRLHAPLFTGLTTYLRGLGPLDPISIFGSTLFVTLDVHLARLFRIVSAGRNLSDTFTASSTRVPPHVSLSSSYFLVLSLASFHPRPVR